MIRFTRDGWDYMAYAMRRQEISVGTLPERFLAQVNDPVYTSEDDLLRHYGREAKYIWRLCEWGVEIGQGVFKTSDGDTFSTVNEERVWARSTDFENRPGPVAWFIVDLITSPGTFQHSEGRFLLAGSTAGNPQQIKTHSRHQPWRDHASLV